LTTEFQIRFGLHIGRIFTIGAVQFHGNIGSFCFCETVKRNGRVCDKKTKKVKLSDQRNGKKIEKKKEGTWKQSETKSDTPVIVRCYVWGVRKRRRRVECTRPGVLWSFGLP
jgi:hypothetical protein